MQTHFSRRQLIQVGALSALGLAAAPLLQTGRAFAASAAPGAATADPFATVRAQWAALTSGGAIDAGNPVYANALAALNSSAGRLLSALDTSTGRTQVFTNLPLGSNSANISGTFGGLKTLALAYVTPGTSYMGDAGVLQSVISGLDFMVAGPYSATVPNLGDMHGYGNWYDWQIGSPQALEDAANLVYLALDSARIAAYCGAIDYFMPDPTIITQRYGSSVSTGANRLDLCRVAIVRGALGSDASKIEQGVAGISDTLPLVTSGDGLYSDGSFIQHTNHTTGLAYTGTYGGIWLGDVALLLSALAGSPWVPTDPDLANVFFAARKAFEPVVYNGLMMDAVRGRAIARAGESDANDGLATVKNFLALAPAADADTAAFLRSTAKGWLQRTPTPIGTSSSMLTIALSEAVLNDASVTAAPEPVNHTLFPVMDRAVHRRSGWAVTLSMASNRIAYYENGGGDNLRGWHTGDGMLYTYLDSDNTQYDDAFWPTVDPYRLPGTTASLKALADGQGGQYAAVHPSTSWVGGTTDGEFAAAGQDLQGPFSTLVAKQSWFFLDDSIVCLGAGITASDGAEIDTVVENRNLGASSTAVLTVDGQQQPAAPGSITFRSARWAYLEGASGYVFPDGADVTALRETRTGSWHNISTGGSTAAVSRDYATLYLDHGAAPSGAGYSYILMPGTSATAVAQRAAQRGWLHTLANTAQQQGIEIPELGVTAANFWTAGTAGDLSSDAPASVLIRRITNGRAVICVSDPAAQNASTTIKWSQPVSAVISRPASVTSVSTGSSLTVAFGDLRGAAGATQQLVVQLA